MLLQVLYQLPGEMKAAPEFLLASLVESELLLNPFCGIETQLEKKASYMQSRVDKLHLYNEQANTGATLTKVQEEARSKLDEVIRHQEYVKHLITMVHRDHVAYDKALKSADAILELKVASAMGKAISQSLVYNEIIKQLAHPSSREAFLSGTNGAIRLSENDLHAILRLQWAFSPLHDGFSSIEELEKKTEDAAKVVAAILSKTNVVVDDETGLQGKDAYALLESIKTCQFFVNGYFLCSNGNKESRLSSVADSSEKEVLSTEADSPLLSANEEGDRTYTENTDSAHAVTNESVGLSDHDELKCVVNSVIREGVPDGKPTSNDARVPSAEASDEHIESTNGSDSGNGTVTPSSDAQSASAKGSKSTRGGKQFFRYRNSNYPRRYPNKESSQAAAEGSPRNNSGKVNGEDQVRRRGGRQYRRGGRANGFAPSNYNENDQRTRGSRPGARASFQQIQAASFHYEPGVGRRPAPTTCGIVFGGRT
ncbi:unnamed protein product [Cylicocyclus nassatus]|uniref:Caprin-1 dimerization domain-containing protein n=1 Tax=Cylicocyclus nassatus TaxID=53992 RepID=A0AA36MIE8_CYLNA|nr:unnamed protein product [Cylicocyclus nassatus]